MTLASMEPLMRIILNVCVTQPVSMVMAVTFSAPVMESVTVPTSVSAIHWSAGVGRTVRFQDALATHPLMWSVVTMVIVTVRIRHASVLLVGWGLHVILLTVLVNQTVLIEVFVMNGALIHHYVRTVRVTGLVLPVTTHVLMEQRLPSTQASVNVTQVLLELGVIQNVLSMV